jgi:hypothetical protein
MLAKALRHIVESRVRVTLRSDHLGNPGSRGSGRAMLASPVSLLDRQLAAVRCSSRLQAPAAREAFFGVTALKFTNADGASRHARDRVGRARDLPADAPTILGRAASSSKGQTDAVTMAWLRWGQPRRPHQKQMLIAASPKTPTPPRARPSRQTSSGRSP